VRRSKLRVSLGPSGNFVDSTLLNFTEMIDLVVARLPLDGTPPD
jgi:hypothetical protein